MGDYLLVCASPDEQDGQALSAELCLLAGRSGLEVSELGTEAWLAVGGPHPPKVMTVSNWTLIGDVLDRRSPALPACFADDPWGYERKLAARFWGRFIGVQFGSRQRPLALLRDPSGAMECVAWCQSGLLIVASAAFDWLLRRLRPTWRISLDRLEQALRNPLTGSGSLLIEGPVALSPGTIQPLPLSSPPVEIWTPSQIARQSLGPWPAPEEASHYLRTAVDEAVTGLAALSTPLAAEVSGGLDSAIVAASLVRHDTGAVRLWLNTFGSTPESDERNYVDALSAKLGIDPVSAPHAQEVMTASGFDDISGDFRPGLNALDRAHNLEWAYRLDAVGAESLITGRGGDTILLQNATADVFIDRWRAQGWRALLSKDARELAAANEASVWTFVYEARRRDRAEHPLPRRSLSILRPSSAPLTRHPWLKGWDDFGPAKALQIAGLVDSVSRHHPSALTRTVDVRSPLCAQPVIEACLALPAPVLTYGGRERGLARHAFRDRLPMEIIERRSKGDMTKAYGRLVRDNLPFLRPWLMQGRLVELGLVDPAEADRALTREALLWHGGYSSIIVLAAFEGWVRRWEDRLGPAR
ncbi:asparagine synthase (glutamine-hydrolyzing) [Brevundimonas bullata]|uniref:Asparagine synthase (Glutamine-hydrolyzing) n=1 Tax=Brevundimonas bullata TaxID=13160 RepID=A0A7W7IR90_9CAUL|nr:asparagine synthase C-terminal domain-containing protein [Brevundimonas bullata]MBB4799060.1 asparagine synthase (glutamine-hydrolyzing) [Brevundimonas bullata]MBB6384245.1 asparagine synthase (glutamine-hydrolyzing) [Brevundimonas bullata]